MNKNVIILFFILSQVKVIDLNWQITESSDEGEDTRESSEGHSATTQASRATPHPTPKPALRRKVLPEAVRQ